MDASIEFKRTVFTCIDPVLIIKSVLMIIAVITGNVGRDKSQPLCDTFFQDALTLVGVTIMFRDRSVTQQSPQRGGGCLLLNVKTPVSVLNWRNER